MRHDVQQVVAVRVDQKIKSPATIHSALPDAPRFIEFLGSHRRMSQVLSEKYDLLITLLPNLGRSIGVAPLKSLRVE